MKWLAAIFTFVLISSYSLGAYAQEDVNCDDFDTKQEVMEFWFDNGYSATNDPHNLDGDRDGYPCEVTKGDYDEFISGGTPEETEEPGDERNFDNTDHTGNNGTTGNTGNAGEAMPDTASDHLAAILASAGLAAAGALLFFRRKKAQE
ncbi:excalibur calcium-binding domain-containing protein [Mesobacillus foraminis]|uniref:LPXTG cell wall anchor domain-containing protein n=1 Tax=Mesobacillus foraminis TaxID=279826 RepID=UPI0039A03ED6